jgi:tetratricopeptide (TPR) repeat protein
MVEGPSAEGLQKFVGRARELQALRSAFNPSADSTRLFLVAGEPGIGKTRLATEISSQLNSQGFQTLWGKCWEDGGTPPYWPWRQVVRSCLELEQVKPLRETPGAIANDLFHIAPEIHQYTKTTEAGPVTFADTEQSEQARFRLHESLVNFLALVARSHPLLIIIDDLHSADVSSLLLLHFLVRNSINRNIFIIGTYRDAELLRNKKRADLIGQLANDCVRLILTGLSENEVELLINANLNERSSATFVHSIYQRTGGNPLFVNELSRLALRVNPAGKRIELAESVIPNGLRAVVRRHLEPLEQNARQFLAVASVLGREFDVSVLERVFDIGSESLSEAVSEAERAGLIRKQEGTIGHYSFSHALISESIRADLPAQEIKRLHLQIGQALEDHLNSGYDVSWSELARHFIASISIGDGLKAAAYARRAAQTAESRLAFEEAENFYSLALEALQYVKHGETQDKCELLCELGELQCRAGMVSAGRSTMRKAAAIAAQLNSPRLYARAALAFAIFLANAHAADTHAITLLRRALELIGDQDDSTRAKLLSALADKLYLSETAANRQELLDRAISCARRSNDAGVLLFVLSEKRRALWEANNLEERLHTSSEAYELAVKVCDPAAALRTLHMRIMDLVELGHLSQAYAENAVFAREAERSREPLHVWEAITFKACEALMYGRYKDAEKLANEAFAIGQALGSDQLYTYSGQIALIYRDKMRLEELEASFRAFVAQNPGVPVFSCTMAYIWMELGRIEDGRREFKRLTEHGLDALHRRGTDWIFILAVLGELCCFFSDKYFAQLIYDRLKHFDDRTVTLFHLAGFGPVSIYLAKLACLLDQRQEGIKYFKKAIDFNEKVGALPWIAEAKYEFARVLICGGGEHDRERAEKLGKESREISEQIQNVRLLTKLEQLSTSSAGTVIPGPPWDSVSSAASSRDGGNSAIEPQVSELQRGRDLPRVAREGEYWTLSFQGQTIRIKDSKGLGYIDVLLKHPNKEIHAFNLVANNPVGERPAAGSAKVNVSTEGLTVSHELSHSGPMLDDVAKKAYRKRLSDLQEELTECKAAGKEEKACELEEEIDALQSELRRALGLRGRDRLAGSAAERARINVTRAIKAVISKITEHDSVLAQHLAMSIRTGVFCSYIPERKIMTP